MAFLFWDIFTGLLGHSLADGNYLLAAFLLRNILANILRMMLALLLRLLLALLPVVGGLADLLVGGGALEPSRQYHPVNRSVGYYLLLVLGVALLGVEGLALLPLVVVTVQDVRGVTLSLVHSLQHLDIIGLINVFSYHAPLLRGVLTGLEERFFKHFLRDEPITCN